jgi:predicted N-formylglutamate amidohydrolase
LSEQARSSHIAWDIGARGVALALSEALDAPLVACGYSRLVIDANRPLGVPSSIPAVSCEIPVPGNAGLSPADETERARAVFMPYHAEVARVLAERTARQQPSVLLSMHSFTPELYGKPRPWHIGVLSGKDRRLAEVLLHELGKEQDWTVGDNEPYRVSDVSDYAVPVYGEQAGRLAVLIELRQDLVATSVMEQAMAQRWLPILERALPSLL